MTIRVELNFTCVLMLQCLVQLDWLCPSNYVQRTANAECSRNWSFTRISLHLWMVLSLSIPGRHMAHGTRRSHPAPAPRWSLSIVGDSMIHCVPSLSLPLCPSAPADLRSPISRRSKIKWWSYSESYTDIRNWPFFRRVRHCPKTEFESTRYIYIVCCTVYR
jgi:hypothetical protein